MKDGPIRYKYFCVPAITNMNNRLVGNTWYLFKEPHVKTGESDWDYIPSGGPTLIATRKAGSRIWNKTKKGYYHHLDIMWSRRESVPEEEALAMLLAAR